MASGGGFPDDAATDLLVDCKRHCCVCHKWCGTRIELDHIVPKADGGSNEIDNAIPVCFDCHAEIHLYNDRHPRGRKFRPGELREHKRRWLEFCQQNPAALAQRPQHSVPPGPIQGLLDELDFNCAAARRFGYFAEEQFLRAIQENALSALPDDLRAHTFEAYTLMRRWNGWTNAGRPELEGAWPKQTVPIIDRAHQALLSYLTRD